MKKKHCLITFILIFIGISVLIASDVCAVFDIPIGNMKHAESLENKGKFKEAAESRELAAEFYEYVTIPQFEYDVEYYTAKGKKRRVTECEKRLKEFREWAEKCRIKAKEDRIKAGSTPEEIENYREKIRSRLIASSKLYPNFHDLDGDKGAITLERNGKFSEDFIRAAELRERTGYLYEKISIRYCLHEAEVLEKAGKTERATEFRKLVEDFQKKAEFSLQKAKEDREKAKTLGKYDNPEYLLTVLNDDDIQLRLRVVEKFAKENNTDGLRQALANDNLRVRHRSARVFAEKWDIPGVLLASQDSDQKVRKVAEDVLNSSYFRAAASKELIACLNDKDIEVRRLAIELLEKYTNQRLDYVPDAPLEQRKKAIREWRQWVKENLKPGLMGIYYKGKNFNKEVTTRIDSQINFHWENQPHPELPKDNFSVRWVGKIYIPADGEYKIAIESDGGVNLWVGKHHHLISDWEEHKPTKHERELYLRKGMHNIRLEYYDRTGDALIQLYWSNVTANESKQSDKIPHHIISAKHLFHLSF